ncbi:hypothetical protein GCM10010967_53420 [Dyadobacter beijingensis]|uniref:Glycosyltransferase RgtA/B/C/D-like domain-containing protein n=1 Tax=Dyadobacter beijingensis TaxID=365489 RepID=A0ABQ2IKZ8_9BACT|nr:glycosyltransferase family 39 protein [Dyadobacter beijingensis]GGN10875.1 hypothetical protein GCM10010967_53420 [Dyadobacter beijingensis]
MMLLIPTALLLATANCYLAFYQDSGQPLRRSLLSGAILLFLFIAVSTELLGAFNQVNRPAITGSWVLYNAALSFLWFRLRKTHNASVGAIAQSWLKGLRSFCQTLGLRTVAMLVLLYAITLVVAVIAVPNNQDSLSYHLSRIGYWVQQGNVAHYASHIERSISFSPFSEYIHLHTFLLSGSERYFELVQWFCQAGILALISMIICHFSGSRIALRVGLCFAATLPIVVLESMTTQNDLVVAFFIVATAFFAFDYLKNNRLPSLYLIPICCALGMMTKGTFLFCALPFGIYLLIGMLRKQDLRKQIAGFAAASLTLTLVLNVPFWYRTYELFGTPVGTISKGNQTTFFGPGDYVSNVLKHLFLHLGFISPGNSYNNFLQSQLENVHQAMGVDINAPGTGMAFKMNKLNFNEDFAHNFFGIWLIILCIPLLFTARLSKTARWYGALTFMSFLIFCFFIGYQIYGSRLHIAFFLLAAPLVGLVFGSVLPAWGAKFLTLFLWLAALPFALLSSSHPLLSTKWFFEKVFPPINSALHLNIRIDAANLNLKQESVLSAEPGRLLWGEHWPEMQVFLAQVNARNPQKIGFDFTEASFDYAYQYLLRQPGRTFAHVRVANPSHVREDPAFRPDVVIAEKPAGQAFDYHGQRYVLQWEADGKWLYVPSK